MNLKIFAMYSKLGIGIFQKCRSYLTFAGARRMTGREIHTDDPHTLGATVNNLVPTEICSPGIVDF